MTHQLLLQPIHLSGGGSKANSMGAAATAHCTDLSGYLENQPLVISACLALLDGPTTGRKEIVSFSKWALTRILICLLHIDHVPSLVFIIGWRSCQVSVQLILWSDFLLEDGSRNTLICFSLCFPGSVFYLPLSFLSMYKLKCSFLLSQERISTASANPCHHTRKPVWKSFCWLPCV